MNLVSHRHHQLHRMIALLATLLGLGAFSALAAEPPPIPVLASIPPLAAMARAVGGDRVTVEVLIPPGQNDHTYSLTPAQARRFSSARMLAAVGLGYEFWAPRMVANANNPRLVVVYAGEGLPGGPQSWHHEEHEGEAHDEAEEGDIRHNPHVWVDPVWAGIMAERIADGLAKADPPHAQEYHQRLRVFQQETAQLHQEYKQALAPLKGRPLVVYHASFAHLAHRYGMPLIAVVEGGHEQEPTPAQMARAIQAGRAAGVKAVFSEPQFPPQAVRLLAKEMGAEVLTLDVLGGAEETYPALMRRNLAAITKGLR
ncbi:MAG: metal ABC transporter substrate-binding protein [Deltaproteobacteria bacterium]|nr:metal ABC transporter substrate-binding protein [Deltaproteobacteria bacterium]MDH4122052.1 metal ABC transporter substrate-binding protein [Deltaproteobacteria bacterium]